MCVEIVGFKELVQHIAIYQVLVCGGHLDIYQVFGVKCPTLTLVIAVFLIH